MKHEIVIPNLPTGYKALAYRPVNKGEWYLNARGAVERCQNDFTLPCIVVERIQPHRRVFECVSDTPRPPSRGEWFININGDFMCATARHAFFVPPSLIWKEVTLPSPKSEIVPRDAGIPQQEDVFRPLKHIDALINEIESQIKALDEGSETRKTEKYKALSFALAVGAAASQALDMDYERSNAEKRQIQHNSLQDDVIDIKVMV